MDKEYEEWYKSCEFIETYLKFYSFKDFYENAYYIKRLIDKKDIRTKKLYRWYIYAGGLQYKQKRAIWEFLNGDIDYEKLKNYI